MLKFLSPDQPLVFAMTLKYDSLCIFVSKLSIATLLSLWN